MAPPSKVVGHFTLHHVNPSTHPLIRSLKLPLIWVANPSQLRGRSSGVGVIGSGYALVWIQEGVNQ